MKTTVFSRHGDSLLYTHLYCLACWLIGCSLFLMCSSARLLAQQAGLPTGAVIDDSSQHHLIFSNPGFEQDAINAGTDEKWKHIMSGSRYQMQYLKRHAVPSKQAAAMQPAINIDVMDTKSAAKAINDILNPMTHPGTQQASTDGEWYMSLSTPQPTATGSRAGTALGQYPAVAIFGDSSSNPPSCTENYAVYPVNVAGSSTQANLIGVDNLYAGTCGTIDSPRSPLFAYYVGKGAIQTSPLPSLDGTKIAFVESIPGSSRFHVLTLDTSGNEGCTSNTSPCNGSAYNTPATPGINNLAKDTAITLEGGVMVTRSSPFVDWDNDVAYLGDDNGALHKFSGVFNGTPAEVTVAPWPLTVSKGVILTMPVYDGNGSQNIFIGGSDSKLYCITSAGIACSTPSITVGTGPILDGPIVDSTAETVFVEANTSTNAVLTQVNTKLGNRVNVTMGAPGRDLHNGAFDSTYYNSTSGNYDGYMYFCGNLPGAATPALYRVGFNSDGTMKSTNDGNYFQLAASGNTGSAVDCTPLSEMYNSVSSLDYLFVGVQSAGFTAGSPNCQGPSGTPDMCVISFVLPQASPFPFPASANATAVGDTITQDLSAFVGDGCWDIAGACQIYFGEMQDNVGFQLSEAALQ